MLPNYSASVYGASKTAVTQVPFFLFSLFIFFVQGAWAALTDTSITLNSAIERLIAQNPS